MTIAEATMDNFWGVLLHLALLNKPSLRVSTTDPTIVDPSDTRSTTQRHENMHIETLTLSPKQLNNQMYPQM